MAAIWGRIAGNGNVVFLSPIISTVVATTVMAIGYLRIGDVSHGMAAAPQIPPDSDSRN
jgi:hypothetical protein